LMFAYKFFANRSRWHIEDTEHYHAPRPEC
jgi:hypothetical protein